MKFSLKKKFTDDKKAVSVVVVSDIKRIKEAPMEKDAVAFFLSKADVKTGMTELNNFGRLTYVLIADDASGTGLEKLRKNAALISDQVNKNKHTKICLLNLSGESLYSFAAAEAIYLATYQFLKYKSEKTANSLTEVMIVDEKMTDTDFQILVATCKNVTLARDWVNEPFSYLNSLQFAKELQKAGKASGVRVEVLNKNKIEALKMGGLLAVNQGSAIPPTFTIMEYKPKNALNKKPILLVGKGVVYDTGGLSLKPTANSMDFMKCDMAGAAVVGAAICAAADAKFPLHIISLIPATDNWPGEKAYAPGDVITMYNGKTVEVLNTDAEGRLILADALAYASKFKPELVFDFATLTGAAAIAIGSHGVVCMGTADEVTKNALKDAGHKSHERLVEFPLWDEYGELIKSDVADIKNLGGSQAGAITAGKFLEHFTSYPWMHFDIAGPSFVHVKDSYRGKGATGVGVRMLMQYFAVLCKK